MTNGNKCAYSPDFAEHRIPESVYVELEMIDFYANFLTWLLQFVLKETSSICSCITSVPSR